jgi:hypothetical protein
MFGEMAGRMRGRRMAEVLGLLLSHGLRVMRRMRGYSVRLCQCVGDAEETARAMLGHCVVTVRYPAPGSQAEPSGVFCAGKPSMARKDTVSLLRY